jgi:hypothetical protein
MRLLIGRADGPFQFACDDRRFSFLADEAFEHANVFFRPRAELQGLLCHLGPLAILKMLRIRSTAQILKSQHKGNQPSGECHGKKMARTVLILANRATPLRA